MSFRAPARSRSLLGTVGRGRSKRRRSTASASSASPGSSADSRRCCRWGGASLSGRRSPWSGSAVSPAAVGPGSRRGQRRGSAFRRPRTRDAPDVDPSAPDARAVRSSTPEVESSRLRSRPTPGQGSRSPSRSARFPDRSRGRPLPWRRCRRAGPDGFDLEHRRLGRRVYAPPSVEAVPCHHGRRREAALRRGSPRSGRGTRRGTTPSRPSRPPHRGRPARPCSPPGRAR